MKFKKIFSAICSILIISSVFAVNVFADIKVTNRVDAKHDGTMGSAYSSCVAVNTTTYNGTKMYWTADVQNKPSDISYDYAAVEWKLYRNTTLVSDLGKTSNVTVGNTLTSGVVTDMIGSGNKTYGKFNNMYRYYINVTLCPPAYKYITTFNVGGVFYGIE